MAKLSDYPKSTNFTGAYLSGFNASGSVTSFDFNYMPISIAAQGAFDDEASARSDRDAELQVAIDGINTSLSDYLTTTDAASTYQTKAGMSSYLTTGSAASTYLTGNSASATYLTITAADATYQKTTNMSSYLLTASANTLYAPKASPALTGTPTAPTAAADTNTTQIATTAFVIGQNYLQSTDLTGYLTTSNAASTYQTQAGMSSYLTTSNAASTYATITNLNLKAASASPAFTGTPTAPTAATATSTTQIATTAYVQANLANYQTEAGMSSYLTTSLAASTYQTQAGMSSYLTTSTASSTYAPKASPALTGTPTAPTAADGTNTTQIATTAFVQAALSGVDLGGAATSSTNKTIAASAVGTYPLPGDQSKTYFFFINKAGVSTTYAYGMVANFSSGTSYVILLGGALADASTSSLTGSTGTTGHITLSVANGTKNLYVENRQETNSFQVSFFG